MLKRIDDAHLLTVAFGQGADFPVQVQIEPVGQLLLPFVRFVAIAEPGQERQRLSCRQARPGAKIAGQITDAGVLRSSSRHDLLAQNAALAACRPQQAHQAAYRGCLARAVRAEITEYLALFNAEGQILDAYR